MITLVLVLVVSYLVGSIPFSWLAVRLVGGIDLRTVGSGNLGATNTFRALGARVALPVLGLDVLKGLVAPLVFARLRMDMPPVDAATLATLAGLAAILGHMFPIYLRFRGGKGIATATGVFVALEPLAFAACFVVFVLAFAVSRGIVSLGSLASSLTLPLAMYAVHARRGDLDPTRLALAGALVVVVWLRHRANIRRLLQGREKSLFARDRAAPMEPPAGNGDGTDGSAGKPAAAPGASLPASRGRGA